MQKRRRRSAARRYLSAKEFSQQTGVHRNTVSRWIQSGRLKAHRTGKAGSAKWEIPVSEVWRVVEESGDETRIDLAHARLWLRVDCRAVAEDPDDENIEQMAHSLETFRALQDELNDRDG